MKLRLIPIVVSLLASSVVLFGGWFLYDSMAMESPLAKIVRGLPGVEQADVSVGTGAVTVDVALKPDASLREIYKSIVEQGASIIHKRDIELRVKDTSSPELDRWWSTALFEVAQAMESKQYAAIPAALEAKKGSYSGLEVHTEIDDKYVYVHLTDGKHDKFVMLPRKAQTMGVWPNE